MKPSLNKLVQQKIHRLLSESSIQDPDKEEMLSYLSRIYGNEEGFEYDAEEAMYWFANFNHGGQSSNLYSVLSTSDYSPGPISRGPEEGSGAEMMMQDLESEFGSKQERTDRENAEWAKSEEDSWRASDPPDHWGHEKDHGGA